MKWVEWSKHSCGDAFFIQGYITKRPSDWKTWKTFLTKDENKIQLIKLLRQLRATIPRTTVNSHCKTKGLLSRNIWRYAHTSKSNTNTIFRPRGTIWKYAQELLDIPYSYIFFKLLRHTLTFSCTIYVDRHWEQQTPGKYDRYDVLIHSGILHCAHGTLWIY